MGQAENWYEFEQLRRRYWRSRKKDKGAILEEVCRVTGWHRKHATRLLGKRDPGRKKKPKQRGRKSRYECVRFQRALKRLWLSSDQMCSKLLKAAIPEWLPFFEKHEWQLDDDVKAKLLQISPATIDRILKPVKAQYGKGLSGTKPGTLLRTEVPIRTDFWDVYRPGFVEADTVAHCGGSMAGNFIWSLVLTDIYSCWTECRAVWNKGKHGVVEQIQDIEAHLAFELFGFDCDNGGEFLNYHLLDYFTEKKEKNKLFSFTRSRPNKKDDNAHVEQKNWSHVRSTFGYDRFDFPELVQPMNDFYSNEYSLFRNHFCPSFKLSHKERIKSRLRRHYDKPKSPYERLLDSEHISAQKKQELIALHQCLDPFVLKRKMDEKLGKIFFLFKQLKKARRERLAA